MNKLLAIAIVSCVVLGTVPVQAATCGPFPGILYPEKVKAWKEAGCTYKSPTPVSLIAINKK